MTTRATQILVCISRSGLVLFTLAIVALHFLSSEFDPVAQGISYYALGKFGWLFTLSLLCIGLACLAVVGILWRECPTKLGFAGLWLLVVWTVMLGAGAFFEMDKPGSVPTLSGRIHSIAGTSFLLLPPAALLIAKSFSRVQPAGPRRWHAWIIAWCVVIASALLIIFNGFLVSRGVGGIVQRAYWLTIVVWLFLIGQPEPYETNHGFKEPASA